MNPQKIRRALISVYDKTGIVDFARALSEEFGIEIISTGGTAKLLKESDIPVTLVEEVTGFPEMLDGRVKTLHPKIHAAILADRDNPEHMRQLEEQGIKPIDMVVVNLYPFEKTVADPNCKFEDAIEMIDIGGPCMLRAAAKNHKHVIPVIGSRSFARVLDALRLTNGSCIPSTMGEHLARIAFHITSRYDLHIVSFLARHLRDAFSVENRSEESGFPAFGPCDELRYGENPHQHAELCPTLTEEPYGRSASDEASLILRESIEAMSYNNYVDSHAALELCKDLSSTANVRNSHAISCGFIKHTNPCGVASAQSLLAAYRNAYLGDPNAAMGGILACSFPIDAEFASAVMETYARWGKDAGAGGFFVEVWIAPEFTEEAVSIIRTSKPWGERVRLLSVGDMSQPPDPQEQEYKSITGGMLVQTRDLIGLNEEQWKVVTKLAPSDTELTDLRLAWLIAKHTKSNAISLCKDGMLIGNGAGQMSRVMSCRIATWLAKENGHAEKLAGSVAASDAFFPFSDGPKLLIDAGVTALIQPGGSKRDEDTIKLCDERGVAMIFTGTRHFKH